ncbi:MAG TPA: gephyrin-like molybdotransferase Glp [Candidatus Methylomirabilis sp.]|nr:gephyrin-like molybdotransferase Glp [Candidatus Methylomirabilis sp.]
MISVEEAQRIILASVEPIGCEYVELLDSLGRVLAEDVTAAEPIPAWDNSAMDGYALRAEETRGAAPDRPITLILIGTAAAGQIFDRVVEHGQAVRIMTGAALPRGADAVIRQEDTRATEREVVILRQVRSGQNVRSRGEDVKAGERVLQCGTLCRPGAIGLLAALGRRRVAVYHRPRVGVLATGDELLRWDEAPQPGKIYNSNSYALAAQVVEAGGLSALLGPVADMPALLVRHLREGMRGDCLVTSGGVSVGDYDLMAETLREFGAEVRVRGVNMRPGKPFTFALLEQKPVFALPGNPISCMVTFELFVRPALRKMQGYYSLLHSQITATAAQAIVNKDRRPAYLRVILTQTEAGYTAALTGDQGSAMLHSMASADGLACVPGETEIPAGSPVRVILLGEGPGAALENR